MKLRRRRPIQTAVLNILVPQKISNDLLAEGLGDGGQK